MFLAAVAATVLSCGPTRFARIEQPVGPIPRSGATQAAVTVQTDAEVAERVSKSARFVGQVSVALLDDRKDVRALQIDGHAPSAADTSYPFRRPLHLCVRKDAPQGARDFVAWALSAEGQTVLAARFAPVRIATGP